MGWKATEKASTATCSGIGSVMRDCTSSHAVAGTRVNGLSVFSPLEGTVVVPPERVTVELESPEEEQAPVRSTKARAQEAAR